MCAKPAYATSADDADDPAKRIVCSSKGYRREFRRADSVDDHRRAVVVNAASTMILSTCASSQPAPKRSQWKVVDFGPPAPMSARSLEEAEQMCSMFLNDYSGPSSPGVQLEDLMMDDFRMDSPTKDFWKLLPTPPRSPDRSDSSSSGSIGGPVDSGAVLGVGSDGVDDVCDSGSSSGGAITEVWCGFQMEDFYTADVSVPTTAPYMEDQAPSMEDQEALCSILFEHDDFIDQLLKDDSVLNSVLGGGGADDGDDVVAEDEEDVVGAIVSPHAPAVVDWLSPVSPTQSAVQSELLHDCMWSGQCTDDCKQKAAREKRCAAQLASPYDLVVSPASAMSAGSPDDVLEMRIPSSSPTSSSRSIAAAAPTAKPSTTSRVAAAPDDALATQCVDPSSVLSYTPLSDHSYHQATSSAPPTPPDSPKAVSQQQSSSATARGGGNGSVGQLTLYRSQNGHWQRGGMVLSDTPSESDSLRDGVVRQQTVEEALAFCGHRIASGTVTVPLARVARMFWRCGRWYSCAGAASASLFVCVRGEGWHQCSRLVARVLAFLPRTSAARGTRDFRLEGRSTRVGILRRHGGAPAVVALPANGTGVGAIRCAAVRQPRPPATAVVSRITSSGRVVTPSHKALNNGQAPRRRRRGAQSPGSSPGVAAAAATMGGKRKRSRQYQQVSQTHHGTVLAQSKRARRDDDGCGSAGSCSPSAGRRGQHALSQLPPSAKRNEHNTMERKRRDDLRVAFQDLRVQVPALFDNTKAAKVTILNEAAAYALKLTYEACHQEKVYKQEQQRHHMLRRRLAQLQQQHQQQQQRIRQCRR
ncbi:hypothetical protein HPB49_000474 [Dermacentor silvarum]|uniref:Uncharacterized protein n=1 Tax=Dermacentor silvarum TaxID=543639 RepID=A0ACB8DLZ2_DERSI|nr:hypothetical protein HPB49_000474 [Dermacentor silvarum]